MKPEELRNKTAGELKSLRVQCKEESFKIRMQMGVENSAKTHEFKRIRKMIARIETLLTVKRKGDA
jgi:large subunit ribosomal protein L29